MKTIDDHFPFTSDYTGKVWRAQAGDTLRRYPIMDELMLLNGNEDILLLILRHLEDLKPSEDSLDHRHSLWSEGG
jgi:hypothetical protein